MSTRPRDGGGLGLIAVLAVASGCTPPSCPDFDDVGSADSNDNAAPFPDWDRLRERDKGNCLTENDECEGYPNAQKYGFAPGQTLKNWRLFDCEGNQREFAEMWGERDDTGLYNKAVLIVLGAGWCPPCREEAKHLAEIADNYRQQQVEFVQVLHEGLSGPATPDVCEWWNDELAVGEYAVWIDPDNAIDEALKERPADGIPYTLIVDANATVRVRKPPPQLSEDELDAALERVIRAPYGD